MSQRVFVTRQRMIRRTHQARHIAAALVIGLALALMGAACVPGNPTGAAPTATPKLTATATPTSAPCSAWRIVSSPNAAQPLQSSLAAVSASSSQAAVAVGGSFREGDGAQSLIERWDGAIWRIATNAGNDFLTAVTALSANDVWAVGTVKTNQTKPPVPLIQHWNGTQWSIVPASSPGATAELNGVVALAANDVWAVGKSEEHPLVQRWDGASWHVVASPTPHDAEASYFNAVARIPGTTQLWAVGAALYAPHTSSEHEYYQPLIERWDGSSWHIMPSPTLPAGAFGSTLNSIVALSATDAWAAGNYTASNHTIRTLIAHWDGTTWKVVASPDAWGTLASVAAAGPHDVRAVGQITSGDGNTQGALIEQWDGATWRTPTLSVPGATAYSVLSGITADSAGNFWAVGSYRNTAGTVQTLTAHCP